MTVFVVFFSITSEEGDLWGRDKGYRYRNGPRQLFLGKRSKGLIQHLVHSWTMLFIIFFVAVFNVQLWTGLKNKSFNTFIEEELPWPLTFFIVTAYWETTLSLLWLKRCMNYSGLQTQWLEASVSVDVVIPDQPVSLLASTPSEDQASGDPMGINKTGTLGPADKDRRSKKKWVSRSVILSSILLFRIMLFQFFHKENIN